MVFKTLQDWLQWLESCHPNEIDLGLERVGQVAAVLTLSLRNIQVVTVAGTNGKGSCVASLSALLLSAGYRVGCFTSPHFLRYNERVSINGEPVDDQTLIDSFEKIEKQRGTIALTYFEFGTLAAIDIFQRAGLDVVILEVGLGGRLDAVNIIDADIAIVTSIDIDHRDWLGVDREQIGSEKAGIFRPEKFAISAGSCPPDSIRQMAKTRGSRLFQLGQHYQFELEGGGESFNWSGQNQQAENIIIPSLPTPNLPIESVAAAIQALHLLNVSTDQVDYQCLARLSLTGRFQQLQVDNKIVILDVAHNPAAAQFLAQRLSDSPCDGRDFAVLALMSDKDVDGIIAPLSKIFDQWSVAALRDNNRAIPAGQLAAKIQAQGIGSVQCYHSVELACDSILSVMDEGDRLVVFGSFFIIAEALSLYVNSKQEKMTDE